MSLRHAAALLLPLLAIPAAAQNAPGIDAANLTQTVRTLASDQFQGRAPGTIGEERTIGYLIGRLQALGLEPAGTGGGWTQPVPLLHTRLGTPTTLAFDRKGTATPLTFGTDIYVSTLQPKDQAVIQNAPMVFVGYGVSAPERGWDDFKGQDLKGKVAVFLINDPDFVATKGEDSFGKFGGRTMTYYGRWTYKFEEAARRGAIGALIVHDTDGVGYGWNVVKSPGGENYGLVVPAEKVTSLALQGWISGETATALFTNAGQDLAKLRTAARRKDFKPIDLGTSFNAAIPVTQAVVQSQNVLAKIPGAKHPDEVVMYGAHWDAYGEGAPDEKGRIYRAGANDDALGVAGLFEIARLFKAAPAPDRTIAFAFWTAEERGLLGSEAYAQNPIFPAEKTVANFGLDILQTAGKAKDVVLVGKGQGTLEDDLARVAATQGRTVSVESLPERGLFYRADHFSLAKRGVPVLLMMGIAGASDLARGGKPAGQAWVDAYTGKCYHQACDAWDESWNLDGAVQDIEVFYQIGDELARSTKWPGWKDGSEFKAIRDKSAATRK
ncbi:peptidase M20 [Sphingopyxis sp. H038]|uniref:M28 family metallopeptidase n=1 Tax=unclassified Sphingopyxis TaxID=2614943 RepID=UPI00072FFB02|nr:MULTISPECIES: M28 family metallopeptidase [unclassified Sphingopyxis]KTE00443.1 peptidase M20 [Sphingopyxis sp. H012]KTE08393.1 peptidase M20 [Sphingopyxis sp. H053]KTE12961.1 peptidase M20 [Sphingopyxis sp. H093]KTE18923.1 peptidase M20 [Sphingopyxis sp. H080]KTE33068.1 peptidase M20 [Sphingopyxis sp. H038]